MEILPQATNEVAKAEKSKAMESNNDLQSVMVLTLSLDALFLLNQLGYCFYFIVETMLSNNEIFYSSNHEEIAMRIFLIRFEAYMDAMSSMAEVFFHCLNFALYVSLSKSMRQEFHAFVMRFCRCSVEGAA